MTAARKRLGLSIEAVANPVRSLLVPGRAGKLVAPPLRIRLTGVRLYCNLGYPEPPALA